MIIRQASPGEHELLCDIAMESKAHWGYAAEQLEAWRPDLRISPARLATTPVHVCEIDGRVVGYYSFDDSVATWELDNLWVRPDSMGRGVGKALLQHARSFAASRGVRRIIIDSDPNAEAFYVSQGAQRIGTVAAPIASAQDRVRPQLSMMTVDMPPTTPIR